MIRRHSRVALILALVVAGTLLAGCAPTAGADTGAATAEEALSAFVQALAADDVDAVDRLVEPGADLGDLESLRHDYLGLDAPYYGEIEVTILETLSGGEDPADVDYRVSVSRKPDPEPFAELGIGVSRADDRYFIWGLST